MKELNFKVDGNKCIHCGLCVKDCIGHVLVMDKNNFPMVSNSDKCIKCQHCFSICPVGAISIFDKKPENSEKILEQNPDNILNLIKSRRSDRHYKNENVSLEKMTKLKNMLSWVPTGCNYHKLHFSFIDNLEVMNIIRNYTNRKIIDALTINPVEKVVNKFKPYLKCFENGDDVVFRGAPHMLIVSNIADAPCNKDDVIIALSYFELYAQSMGLGTCWCGFFENCIDAFPELLKYCLVPEGYTNAYAILFGEKTVKYSRTIQPEAADIVSITKQNLNDIL